jgi:hypothetical protein
MHMNKMTQKLKHLQYEPSQKTGGDNSFCYMQII